MKTVKERSQKQEKSVAKDFDAKVTVASGALWGQKGDVRNSKYLIECKTTEKDHYILNARTWEKIEREAIRDGLRIPLMVIDLEDDKRIVVFKLKDFNNFPIHVKISPITKKSAILRVSDLGYNKYGDYIYMRVFNVCGTKDNALCCMLQKDFNEFFKDDVVV